MNTNYEVLNYLNLTSNELGKLYKLTGYNPLPSDFVLTKKAIKERLLLGQLECPKIPNFVFESKKELKKRFKTSLKNVNNVLKKASIEGFDVEFVKKMDFYFNVRREVTQIILKKFGKVDFDECDAYLEIYALDPIFSDLLEVLYEENFDLSCITPKLQKEYSALREKRFKTLAKKETKRRKTAEKQAQMVRENVKMAQKTKKSQKVVKMAKHNNKEKS